MESLHAPWRIEYILARKPELKEGLFTRIAQSSDDEANFVVVRDRTCFALLNRYPYNGGHLMVVPYKEVADLNRLTDQPDGFNVGITLGKVPGADILEHLHIHIVPRWNGDTNFMPVIAGTSVVPEALKEIAAKLRAELGK